MKPTVAPRTAPPWWIEDALALEGGRVDAAPLAGDLDADVAIVGGGYTGLWTALALSEREPAREGRRARGGVLRRRAERPERRLRRGLLAGRRRAARAVRRRGAPCALAPRRGIRPPCERSARTSGCARRDADGGDDRARRRRRSSTPSRRRAALGRPEQAVPLSASEVAGRMRSPLFRRGVLFPDSGDRSSRPARARAAPRGARSRRRAARGDPRHRASSRASSRTAGGQACAPREIVVATNAGMTDWRPVRGRLTVFGSYVVLTEPVPELLEPDRLDGWRGDRRRADVPALLPHDERRARADGQRLGADRRGNRIDPRFTHDAPTAARASSGCAGCCPGSPRRRSNARGAARSTSRPTICRSSAPRPERIHFAAGYSGNGVGPSWLAGQALASLALGRDDEWTRLPLVHRGGARVPREPFRYVGVRRSGGDPRLRGGRQGRTPRAAARPGRRLAAARSSA